MPKSMRITIFLACLIFPVGAVAADTEAYRDLEWKDLVPVDWRRPIILPAPPEEGEHHEVDKSSLVHDLDQVNISMPGFMIPVKFKQNVVSEFLLVPFLERHTIAHIHHDPNQIVYVYLESPVPIQNPYAPVLLKGKLRVTSVITDEGATGYTVEQGKIEAYEY
jgi:hypothetical protein